MDRGVLVKSVLIVALAVTAGLGLPFLNYYLSLQRRVTTLSFWARGDFDLVIIEPPRRTTEVEMIVLTSPTDNVSVDYTSGLRFGTEISIKAIVNDTEYRSSPTVVYNRTMRAHADGVDVYMKCWQEPPEHLTESEAALFRDTQLTSWVFAGCIIIFGAICVMTPPEEDSETESERSEEDREDDCDGD